MATTDRTIRWIESLAAQEVEVSSGHSSSIDLCTAKDEVLIGETVGFVRELIYSVQYLVKLFNNRVQTPELQIKAVRPTEKPGELTLLRNQIKLTVFSPQPGKIQIRCIKMITKGDKGLAKTSPMFSSLIEAQFGKFHDIEWYFLKNRVSPEQVARHHLTEFIQVSRPHS